MSWTKIPKRNGKFRLIYSPTKHHKKRCKYSINWLQSLVREVCDLRVVHGFAELRSPVTNAQRHVGYKYTLNFDLSDFFNCVTQEMFLAAVASHQKPWMAKYFKYFFVEALWDRHVKVAAQGLPSSPMVANICAAAMDRDIVQLLFGRHAVYTRYADDLTISFNDPDLRAQLETEIPKLVEKHGFKVNPDKTHFQSSRGGNRNITGVSVSETGVSAPRKTRRRLRAALHNASKAPNNKRQQLRAMGLGEWCKMKTPHAAKRSTERIIRALKNHPEKAIAEIARRTVVHESLLKEEV
jgi:RNA-directed DNA polymerase